MVAVVQELPGLRGQPRLVKAEQKAQAGSLRPRRLQGGAVQLRHLSGQQSLKKPAPQFLGLWPGQNVALEGPPGGDQLWPGERRTTGWPPSS